MATPTKQDKAQTETAEVEDLFSTIQEETTVTPSGRGRQATETVTRIRGELEKMLNDRTLRSFKVEYDDPRREKMVRDIRSAGKLSGKENIAVTTSYNRNTGKLVWGPKSVFDELKGKSKAA